MVSAEAQPPYRKGRRLPAADEDDPAAAGAVVVDLSDTAKATVLAINWFIWAAFALEYVIRLALTGQRARLVRQRWPDFAHYQAISSRRDHSPSGR
jgi:hypothetical protein